MLQTNLKNSFLCCKQSQEFMLCAAKQSQDFFSYAANNLNDSCFVLQNNLKIFFSFFLACAARQSQDFFLSFFLSCLLVLQTISFLPCSDHSGGLWCV
jgi:hypothetical protein